LYRLEELGFFDTDFSSSSSVAFSPDGSLLASAKSPNNVMIWRVSDGVILHTLKVGGWPYKMVYCLAFSPDGSTLALGSDNNVQLRSTSNFALLRELVGHTSRVGHVSFSPDGTMLASASDDQTVRLWRFSHGELIRMIEVHKKVKSIAFSPDGAMLASASDDPLGEQCGILARRNTAGFRSR
jgi:WD40 repeat protein